MEKDEIALGKAEDLRGQKFGKLTALYRTKPPEHVKNKTVYWKCKCDCGKLHITTARSLKVGTTTSCGCNKGPRPKNAKVIDETGNKYGLLTVIERAGSDKKTRQALWRCKCSCGNETFVTGVRLRRGDVKSCGCLIGKNNVKLIAPGTRFGHLTVLEREGSKDNRATYKCQCDCGNIIILNSNVLRRRNNTTCGCDLKYQPTPEDWLSLTHKDEVPLHKAENLSGQKFGQLTALYRTKVPETSQSKHEAFWKCKCDCGNLTTVIASALKNGTSQSCGCSKKFHGEEKIQNILQNNNIIFTREKSFKNCIGPQGGKLRFDFYVNENYLIEYDGKQHFYIVERFGGKEEFQLIQKRDQIKNEYCLSHNIPLIRIPYTHYDKITIDDLRPETSKFLVTA